MTDLSRLREQVEQATSGSPSDALEATAQSGLKMAFNDRAPERFKLSAESSLALSVESSVGRLTSRQLALASDHFARAVAAIGHEISDPSQHYGQLAASDYARAPIYTTSTPGGALLFSAARGGLIEGQAVESLSEKSLTRLAMLLPSAPDDPLIEGRVLALRAPSARAVLEVAQTAKDLHGLRLELRGGQEVVKSVVTDDQADFLDDILKDATTQVEKQHYEGRLDGMRYKRRMFYLETEGGHEVSGVVDEALVNRVNELLNDRVQADVERVTRRNRAGIAQRPTFRLVDLRRLPALWDDNE